MYLKSSNFDFDFDYIDDFFYKKELMKATPYYAKLVEDLMMEFRNVLTNELSKELPPNKVVVYKIDLILRVQPLSKISYRLN